MSHRALSERKLNMAAFRGAARGAPSPTLGRFGVEFEFALLKLDRFEDFPDPDPLFVRRGRRVDVDGDDGGSSVAIFGSEVDLFKTVEFVLGKSEK